MSTLLKTYPIFESNQVLTSTQLNTLVDYLDEQNRLTRARLIGMGVVCGLEVSYDASRDTVSVSKGTGITSEGYLITLDDYAASNYRTYHLPAGTVYEPFVNSQNEQDITLYELIADDAEKEPDDKKLDDETFLDDKVVLLFIESFDKDLKSCLGKSCDELGKQRILTVRALLVSIDDLEKVWGRTNTGKLDAIFPEKFDLPVINLPRVLFDPDNEHAKKYEAFCESYAKVVLSVFEKVVNALSETYEVYRPLLLDSYNEKNPFEKGSAAENLKQIYEFLDNPDETFEPYLGVQYVYDFFQDILLACNEFRQAAFDLMSECCPDMERFPKHLMLGEVLSVERTRCESTDYRHLFVQPPVYNLQKELVQRTISLHNRMVLMIESFDLQRVNGLVPEELEARGRMVRITPGSERISGERGLATSATESLEREPEEKGYPIRITPSLEKQTPLSERPIPWYYAVNRKSSYSDLGTLKEHWNYTANKMCEDESGGSVLNYDDQSDDPAKAGNKLSKPLRYDIDEYSFLRIEGHIGKNVNSVLERVNDIKTRYNLPFQALAVQLNPGAGELEPDYSCGFEDIQEAYSITRSDILSFFSEFRANYRLLEEHRDMLMEHYGEAPVTKFIEAVQKSGEVLEALLEATGNCIDGFSFGEFQERYKALLEQSRELLLIENETIELLSESDNRAEGEEVLVLCNQVIPRVFEHAHQIKELLFYKRLLPLYYFFARRAHYMRARTAVFSDFLREHPGLDHQAGTTKGGTFVLLYHGKATKSVIADFTLPYLCCDTGSCVPICDDEDGGFDFNRPPFARPDFAIAQVNTPVVIDVMKNDVHLPGDDFAVAVVPGEEPEHGKVMAVTATARFVYIPEKEYKGGDVFEYAVRNQKTGATDTATVKVIVRGAAEDTGDVREPVDVVTECYSAAILECWGEEFVKRALEGRDVSRRRGDNIYTALLTDLRQTGGFTAEEIQGGVLESKEARTALLDCLDITYGPQASYEALAELIQKYQQTHCRQAPGRGDTEGVSECYSAAILECWGQEFVQQALEKRNVLIRRGENIYTVLLRELRQTGGFTAEEMRGGVLESKEARTALLDCLDIAYNPQASYETLGKLIQKYQRNYCGRQ